MQRTSSDLRLNPHVHAVFLDGVFREGPGGEVVFHALPRLETEQVAGVLQIVLKKRFSDGTFAVDLDPLSLLTRLCASVPPPRFHTVRYAGVLASASKLRPRILPEGPKVGGAVENANEDAAPRPQRCRYRPWAELMMRTFAVDVLCCPRCSGRLRLVAMTEMRDRELTTFRLPRHSEGSQPINGELRGELSHLGALAVDSVSRVRDRRPEIGRRVPRT